MLHRAVATQLYPSSSGREPSGFCRRVRSRSKKRLRRPSLAGLPAGSPSGARKSTCNQLKEAYFHSKVLSRSRYAGVVGLLEIFAKHLSMVANQIAMREADSESPLVRRARAYIAGHYEDPVSLEEVANAMHVSTFYFCKIFKKATGLTFTDYLGRVRIEKAKTLLLNRHLRISEIAYIVGFQSLTHFNRVFRKLTGESPTLFRANGSLRERGKARAARLGVLQLRTLPQMAYAGIAA